MNDADNRLLSELVLDKTDPLTKPEGIQTMPDSTNNRRNFIKQSATAIAATTAVTSVATAAPQADANSKIRIGSVSYTHLTLPTIYSV